MRIVVALGGNALLRRGENPDARVQQTHIDDAARALAPLIDDHEVIICHGNGPQVGLLAVESTADDTLVEPYPLDALGAQTQGMIGYWLAQSLRNHSVARPAVAVVTQTVVDADDPAFRKPDKFIGPGYDDAQAAAAADRHGWQMAADGTTQRRVVASPAPVRLVEQRSIAALVDMGTLVICAGGGGAPVVEEASGRLRGVDAVVDKDHVAGMLARHLHADLLLVLTDVDGVYAFHGSPYEYRLNEIDVDGLDTEAFTAGSMRPKIEACREFVEATGHDARIGALEAAVDIVHGRAGTAVVNGTRPGSSRTGTTRPDSIFV